MEKFKFLLEKFKEELRSYGFTKKGTSFYTKESSNWGIIHFQKSRHSERDNILFTITLGVCSEKLRSFLKPISLGKPEIEECHWRKRIGFLMDPPKDHWWELKIDSDVDLLFYEIKNILISKGIFEIRNNIADEDLEKAWLSGITSGLTEFERLIYLTALLKLYNRPNLKEVAMALKVYSIEKPVEETAERHIRKLGLQL